MHVRSFFSTLLLGCCISATAQNTSPFWSLAGNSNANTSSKLGTTNAVPLRLMTKNTERIRLDTLGRVGVGTTTPGYLLDVNGRIRLRSGVGASNTAGLWLNRPDNSALQGFVGIANTSTMGFFAGSGWGLVMNTNNGNVGVGTTTPGYLLDVAGRIRLRSGGAADNTAGLWLNKTDNSGTQGFMGVASPSAMGLYSNISGWGLVMNTNNGNVGIGTTFPTAPLQVVSSSADIVIRATSSFSGTENKTAILASSENSPGYGVGIEGLGGHTGVYGEARGGSYNGQVYGVQGYATSNGSYSSSYGVHGSAFGTNKAYGVFGSASGAIYNAAGHFAGTVYAPKFAVFSDRKLKKDIAPAVRSLEQVLKLKPSVYTFDTNTYKSMHLPTEKQVGLIADEVKQVFPELVQKAVHPAEYDREDRHKIISPEVEYEGVNYIGLITVLVGAVQEQQKLLIERDKKIEQLEVRLSQLETLITRSNSTSVSLSAAYLEQNTPNPSSGTTAIRYGIPGGANRAQLLLTDALGRTIKTFALSDSGTINLNVSGLSSGVYHYFLVVDGATLQTRKMTVQH